MKKAFQSFFCLLISILFLLPATGYALSETKVEEIVTNERGVSLRSSPMKADNKICGIHGGVRLEVLGIEGGWYYVYYDGQYGYVASGSEYVTISKYKTESSGPSSYNSNPTSNVQRNNTETRQGNNWFCPTCGQQYPGDYSFCPQDGTSRPGSSNNNELYDMGIPNIGNTVYRENMMNMVVFWVQTQLKATQIWYQGYQWDVTGNLGDHTISEIRSFMQSRGYRNHTGNVDQAVIDELANYLGDGIQPVYVGGFYESMNSIMVGGSTGSMYQIVSNLRDMVPRETIGARWVQCVLKGLGYYTTSIDGKYGEGTEKAVKKFQKDHGFQERDYVTLGVARAMLEQYYYGGNSLALLP